MPAAIPLAVMAAGAVASKVAKDRQAKKQGKNNQVADDKYNELNTGFGDKMSGIGDEERGKNNDIFNRILGGAGTLWDQAGNQAGASYTPRMSESQGFYKNAMNTGLFDEGQKNDFRARGALQNSALFSGLKRRLDQGANVRGGGFSGYSGQGALLQRDAARQAEESRLNSENSLQGMIRQNMFGGAGGVASNDADFARQGLSAAQLEGQNQDRSFGQRSSLLNLLGGLRGNDLGYYGQAGGAYRGHRVTPEQAGTPWYGTVGDAAQGAAGAYMGGGFGGAGKTKQIQQMPTSNRRFDSVAGY